MEKHCSKICVRFCVHTEASAIDFREYHNYCKHLNSKKDASKILMQFTMTYNLKIKTQSFTEPKRNQTGIVFLDFVSLCHTLHRRLSIVVHLSTPRASFVSLQAIFLKGDLITSLPSSFLLPWGKVCTSSPGLQGLHDFRPSHLV